jgi:pyrroline-5-carboxylate reductase
VHASDVVIVAVKPQDFDAVLDEMKGALGNKLVISIAAGITTGHIEKVLRRARVIRVMPNIAAKIGEGESVVCKGNNARDTDLVFAKKLFDCLGKTWIMREKMIDAATAISGSGPAYIFYDMEVRNINPKNVPEEIKQEYIARLTEAAEGVGFAHRTASELGVSTAGSSVQLAAVSALPPAELRKQVTSRGGTTEAALKVLAAGGSWAEAAIAAKKRAAELSR